MTIGERIKALRRQHDMTQEKLAAYLGISFQSVSKWENNLALPDISYLLPLANLFGITADELLGRSKEDEYLQQCEAQWYKLQHDGQVQESIKLCREVVKQYPNNYQWLVRLASPLCCATYSPAFPVEERETARNEGIELCHRIMEDCTDDLIRASCRQKLIVAYSNAGEKEKALAEADKAPTLVLSREVLRDLVERDDNTLLQYMDLLTMAMIQGDEHIIRRHEAVIALWHLVIDDGNFLFYHERLANNHILLAAEYARIHNREKMYENLRKGMEHALAFDHLPKHPQHYTATFVRKATYTPANTSKNYTGTLSAGAKKSMRNHPCFAPYREETEFAALLQQ